MKIIIFSDSHGAKNNLQRALLKHPDAQVALFCGDGAADFYSLADQTPQRRWIAVRGNCDPPDCRLALLESANFGDFHTAILHGHSHGVKWGDGGLYKLAQEGNYQLIIHGHTHVPRSDYIPGDKPFYLFNPGAVRAGHYGLITIREHQILLSHAKLS